MLMTLTVGLTEVGVLNLVGVPVVHAQPNSAASRPVAPPPGVSSLDQLLRQIQEQVPPVVPPDFPPAPLPGVSPQASPTSPQTGEETVTSEESREEIYRLGPGDVVRITIFDLPDYSGEYQILVDGSLTLPRIGRVILAGLTLEEAGQLLTDRFSANFIQPITTVALTKARPLRLAISGEITRPGSYNLAVAEGALYPTVTDLMKEAGGITQNADLRNVRVSRRQDTGQPQTLTLDLWDLILKGDLGQNITLRDGDSVVIPKTTIRASELADLVAANVSPDVMRVGVVGEVRSPGVMEVPPNTSLNQALLRAGGFNPQRARRGSVRLLRLNPDGTATDRRIKIDFEAGINEQTNPLLRPNDVVVVGRSSAASFGDAMESILSPLARVIGTTLSISNFIFQVFGGNSSR